MNGSVGGPGKRLPYFATRLLTLYQYSIVNPTVAPIRGKISGNVYAIEDACSLIVCTAILWWLLHRTNGSIETDDMMGCVRSIILTALLRIQIAIY